MKIITLKAENFKKLSAIEITPDGNVVQITGKNEAGKSSVLDAIEAALKGRAGHRDTLKKGTEKGKVVLDMGDFLITRSFTADNQYLKVETKDGFERKSPQKFLDDLMGSISFDPLQFIHAEAKKQREILLQFTGLDLDGLDRERAELYSERTVVNRQTKEAETIFTNAKSFDDAPGEKVVVSEILKALESVRTKQGELKARETKLSDGEVEVDRLNNTIESIENKIAALNQSLIAETANRATAVERRDKLNVAIAKASVDIKRAIEAEDCDTKIAVFSQQIEEAESTNAKVEANAKKAELKAAFVKATNKATELSGKIDAVEAKKKAAIDAAKFPIEGLGFTADAVTFGGITLPELSSAQKIRVGLAISMALNPKLRVLRITDGSLLDSDSMKIISEMTAKNDFQVWIEKVDETGKVGFVIEDGALKDK